MASSTSETLDQPHGSPSEGLECLVTMEDITEENYVEYRSSPTAPWRPALVEQAVVEQLMKTQFHTYLQRVKTTDCQAELRRLLATGPPVYVTDRHGLPVEEDESVTHLWFSSDQTERSGMLDGAVTGEEREKLWNELREFIVEQGGSDDEGEGAEAGTG